MKLTFRVLLDKSFVSRDGLQGWIDNEYKWRCMAINSENTESEVRAKLSTFCFDNTTRFKLLSQDGAEIGDIRFSGDNRTFAFIEFNNTFESKIYYERHAKEGIDLNITFSNCIVETKNNPNVVSGKVTEVTVNTNLKQQCDYIRLKENKNMIEEQRNLEFFKNLQGSNLN